jgi:protein-tyrosine-phosphatase
MGKILFICEGNVGRSQMAEAFYNYYTKSNDASSAGTDPKTPKKYIYPTEEVTDVMKEEGIDVSNKKVKTINKDLIKGKEKIYILCSKKKCPDYLLNLNNLIFWEIDDPYKVGLKGTRKIKKLIKLKVLSVV